MLTELEAVKVIGMAAVAVEAESFSITRQNSESIFFDMACVRRQLQAVAALRQGRLAAWERRVQGLDEPSAGRTD